MLKTSTLKQCLCAPWHTAPKNRWWRSPMRKKHSPESNINKNNVNAEAEMWSVDSAQPCLITVHLGQRPNGRLGCRPRQTTFYLASTARKSRVWLMLAHWCRQSTNYKDKQQMLGDDKEILTNDVSAQVQKSTTVVKLWTEMPQKVTAKRRQRINPSNYIWCLWLIFYSC